MTYEPYEATCVACYQRFQVSRGEEDFYFRNGLQMPKRCRPCRARRRAEAERQGDSRMTTAESDS